MSRASHTYLTPRDHILELHRGVSRQPPSVTLSPPVLLSSPRRIPRPDRLCQSGNLLVDRVVNSQQSRLYARYRPRDRDARQKVQGQEKEPVYRPLKAEGRPLMRTHKTTNGSTETTSNTGQPKGLLRHVTKGTFADTGMSTLVERVGKDTWRSHDRSRASPRSSSAEQNQHSTSGVHSPASNDFGPSWADIEVDAEMHAPFEEAATHRTAEDVNEHEDARELDGLSMRGHEQSRPNTTEQESEDDEEMEDEELDQQTLTALEQQYNALSDDIPNRIHILGTGSIGKLVAHSLRSLPDPPEVTLLLHRYRLMKAWKEGPQTITLRRHGKDIRATGFEIELRPIVRVAHGVVIPSKHQHLMAVADKPHETAAQLLYDQDAYRYQTGPKERTSAESPMTNEPIDHLIVTTKTAFTVSAMLSIVHRIKPWTTICLLQNGMGMVEKLNEKVFKNPARRPTYIQGVITHGANVPPKIAAKDPFYVVHAGQGSIALGLLARDSEDGKEYPERSRWLLRTMTRSPALVAVIHNETELLQLQLEKLAVNCIINPLTSLLDTRNGNLNNFFQFKRVIRLMLAEISLVIRSLPELTGLPNVLGRFHPSRLEALVEKVARDTGENISSMLADMRAGNRTEIDYINGYIIRRGEELGIKCVVNYSIMHTVKGKAALVEQETRLEGETQMSPDLNKSS